VTAPGSTATAGTTAVEAREELGKFFALAAMAGHKPGMFSRFIDEEWHRLAETLEYIAFCERTAAGVVRHDPTCGEGVVTWVDSYHERHGPLPVVWFADEAGVVDTAAYDAYLATRTVRASWNCTADTGGDGDKK
jgi:hypothetical protein